MKENTLQGEEIIGGTIAQTFLHNLWGKRSKPLYPEKWGITTATKHQELLEEHVS